jgi:hypothetical protein
MRTRPSEQAAANLVKESERNWLPGLLLDNGRAVLDSSVCNQLADLQLDQIAASEFAIDRQIEHGQIANSSLVLEMMADGQQMPGLEGGLGPIKRPLFHGTTGCVCGAPGHSRCTPCLPEPRKGRLGWREGWKRTDRKLLCQGGSNH